MASRLIKPMDNGRTSPLLIECEDEHGALIEVVAKFSRGCMEREKNLAIEALVSMLAADLELPIPEPFIVEIDAHFSASLQNPTISQHVNVSNRLAFGSRNLPSGFAVWSNGQTVPKSLTQEAAEIFVFDAIIVNSDRRPVNPNCLFSGIELAIFDHELALAPEQVLFWTPPWQPEGFDRITARENHIFSPPYFEVRPSDLDRFVNAWKNITLERFNEYRDAIPPEWINGNYIEDSITYLTTAKTNIETIAANALHIFS